MLNDCNLVFGIRKNPCVEGIWLWKAEAKWNGGSAINRNLAYDLVCLIGKAKKRFSLSVVFVLSLLSLVCCDGETTNNANMDRKEPEITKKIIEYANHTLKFTSEIDGNVVQYSAFYITDLFPRGARVPDAVNQLSEEGFEETNLDEELDALARQKTNKIFLDGTIYSRRYYDGNENDCRTNKYFVFVSLIEHEHKMLEQAYGMAPYIIAGNCGKGEK